MSEKKMTVAQQVNNIAVQNGYNSEWFASKALNKLTGDFYKAMARGSLALWDIAETLSEIDKAISDGVYAETDPDITTFSAYCEKVNIDRSNYTKYIRAFREYSELKTYGFSIGVAVALLGTNCPASDFVANYTPVEMSVRKAQEWAKEYKARMLTAEESSDDESEEQTTDKETIETTLADTEEETEENKETEMNYKYRFTESTIETLIKAVAIYSNLTHTTDIETILESDRVRDILIMSATGTNL